MSRWARRSCSNTQTGPPTSSIPTEKGTPRAQTNLSAQVVETWESYPYGEQWTMTGGVGNKHHFTGKERDAESSNDYFGLRYYYPNTSRWLSADSIMGNPANPQRLNRYSYSLNDPINHIDSLGADPFTICIATPGGVVICGIPIDGGSITVKPAGKVAASIDPRFFAGGGETLTRDTMPKPRQDEGIGAQPPDVSPPVDASDPIARQAWLRNLRCDRRISAAMISAWNLSHHGDPSWDTEPLFIVSWLAGHYRVGPVINTNERNTATVQGKAGRIALFHVHQDDQGAKPSTPGTANGIGDTGRADQLGIPYFVMSSFGLWVYDPMLGTTTQLENNLDWTKPCEQQ
jgi:RHS repeat-associated protein